MSEKIEKTLQFLKETFDKSEYWKTRPESKRYRYEHSIRVAKIGGEIARQEGMDIEAMTIACLLHDLSYGLDFNEERTIPNHGYTSAVYARPFLENLGYSGEMLNNICYGIAFHCSEPNKLALIEGEKNTFTDTILDADGIDHNSIYRLYEDLTKENFLIKTPEEQQKIIWEYKGYIDYCDNGHSWKATKTAEKLFAENMRFRREVIEKLQKLIDDSKADFQL
ncbi:MAG: HD domain-containing protein [Treponema sp.]|nr:HD domain-containing protein [Treponema sp.]